MDNKRIKILIACHKPFPVPNNDQYLPIQVGKSGASIDLGIQGDDEGDNISEKNYCYCELTALYWAWKNLKDVDVIGLCHYRRYFDFHKQGIRFLPDTAFPVSAMNELDFSMDQDSLDKVLSGDVVVPKPLYWNSTMKQQYCEGHVSDDFRILQKVVYETQDEKYKKAFEEVFEKGYKFRPYNMMVMRWADFDAYCAWLFGLLFEIEKKTDISHYSVFQKRIYGFMSERLLGVWLFAEGKQLIDKPVIFLGENCTMPVLGKFCPRKVWRHLKGNWRCARINRMYRKSLL